jgi:hypothetical protein
MTIGVCVSCSERKKAMVEHYFPLQTSITSNTKKITKKLEPYSVEIQASIRVRNENRRRS